jgi:ABC-type uncharacterized transport system permease subunit
MKRVRELLRRAAVPALALVTAFLLGAVLIVLTDFEHLALLGSDPGAALGGAIGTVIEGYGAIIAGGLGDPGRIATALQTGEPADVARAIRPITETLLSATPFIFVCLGLAVAFHAGLFNLGADGQFQVAGFGAAIVAGAMTGVVAPGVALVAGLAGGALFGAAYGFIPGLLRARTGAHEFLTTLMLNFIAGNAAVLIATTGILRPGAGPLPQVPLLLGVPTIRLDYGLLAALVTAAAVSFLLFRTTLGFELRATGFSRSAARGAGIGPGRSIIMAMSLSGGLVGLGSAFFLLGPADGNAGPPAYGMGYIALALTLIAGLRPLGIVLIAVLYGALNNGANAMVIATGIPLTLLLVIVGLALLFVSAPDLIRSIWRIRLVDGHGAVASTAGQPPPEHGI